MRSKRHFLTFLLVIASAVFTTHDVAAQTNDEIVSSFFNDGVSIDLHEPTFSQGVFTTQKGGVITAPNLRIQARNIVYTRKLVDGVQEHSLVAEEDLMIQYGDYIFVGQRLEYNFITKMGVIFEGKTSMEPWFFGGKVIHLLPEGTYYIADGYLTTDENICPDWKLSLKRAQLKCNRFFMANDVKFCFFDVPFFWAPAVEFDLESLFESPLSYSFKWGGHQGPRAGISYEFLSWKRFSAFVKLDYRLNRGPGGGIETFYTSANHKESLETINYLARDNSVYLPKERTRYRFQGSYSNLLYDDSISVDLTWDKLSDQFMATDYDDQGIELETAGRTQLDIRRQEDNWAANLVAHVRVNSFETVKQELPTFMNSWRPYVLGPTGIISDSQFKLSYLDFVYASHIPNVKNYGGTRLEFSNLLYRPIVTKTFIVTPEAGVEAIFYGNGPHGNDARWLVQGLLGCEVKAPVYRFYPTFKHVIEPYASFQFYTSPTISPNKHYIFDIDDGLVHLNISRFGTRNSLYRKNEFGCINRELYLDLYAYGFMNIHTIPGTVPKVYADTVWKANDYLKYTLTTAWDFVHNKLDHFNLRAEWTVNADLAFATEYRHRDAYDWRKADRENFMLDAFRSIDELLHSSVSDRRDTFLVNAFYRFLPNWAFQYEARHGWNRRFEKSYTEFELDLITTVYSAGQVKLSYQHREGEDRVAIYFTVGLPRPEPGKCIIPCLDF